MRIEGKVALITGGARMGEAVARALAGHGCGVALAWRGSREAAEAAAGVARAAGVRAGTYRVDARDEAAVSAAVDQAAGDFGRLDILINMASTYRNVPFEELDAEAWSEAVGSNARSAYLFSIRAAPHMKKGGGGRIVNFSDWLAVSDRPRYRGYTPYYTAKAAVAGLTESLALELAPDVLVNAIAPGPILPPAGMDEEEARRVIAATPLGRWGGPEEIARAVVFLVQTDFVTGECLRVDGGRHLY